jgi:predicted lactoylglutathione lyase
VTNLLLAAQKFKEATVNREKDEPKYSLLVALSAASQAMVDQTLSI